ncbi:MAG: aconitase family protein, partial [Acidobacteriota bacterium]
MSSKNSFGTAAVLSVHGKDYRYFSLRALEAAGRTNLARLPYSIRIVLENLLRNEDDLSVKAADINYVAQWDVTAPAQEIAMSPARVLLQDFTGVPCVVDLAAMRDALAKMGADPKKANPLIPVDLVIDHSVQV